MKNLILNLLKSLLVFLFISIAVLAIILLPREPEVLVRGAHHIETNFPFSWEEYKASASQFFMELSNNGFGLTKSGVPVLEATGTYIGKSLHIILPAFIISLMSGIVIGVVNYRNYYKKKGALLRAFNWLCTSIPDFFILVGLQFLIITLIAFGFPKISLFTDDQWYSFIIPTLVIAIYPMMYFGKITQQALLNQEDNDYVRTARSKGSSMYRVVYHHMLGNSWQTILSHIQTIMLYILTSLPIIELLTGYRGGAYYLLQAIKGYDTNMTIALLFAFMVIMLFSVWFSQIIKYIVIPSHSGD